jgi:hypothetical protein
VELWHVLLRGFSWLLLLVQQQGCCTRRGSCCCRARISVHELLSPIDLLLHNGVQLFLLLQEGRQGLQATYIYKVTWLTHRGLQALHAVKRLMRGLLQRAGSITDAVAGLRNCFKHLSKQELQGLQGVTCREYAAQQ